MRSWLPLLLATTSFTIAAAALSGCAAPNTGSSDSEVNTTSNVGTRNVPIDELLEDEEVEGGAAITVEQV